MRLKLGLKLNLNLKAAGFALVAAPALASPLWAQEASKPDTIIVEGLRTGETAVESGTAITLIDHADIERRALTFGGDAAALAPGVSVSQSGSFGGVSYARIRGNDEGQTLVLLDGVPVNDPSSPSGGFDFSTFDLSAVDRIEVLRGPQSTLWGSDAIGGVISIVTQKPHPGIGWGGFAEGGSFDTWRAGANISGGADHADGRLSAVWENTNGISTADARNGNTEKDGFDNFSLFGRGGVDVAPGLRADLTGRWTKAKIDFDGFPPPNFVLADTDDFTKSNELDGSATLTADSFGGRLENTLQATHMEIDRKNFGGGVETSRNQGEATDYRYLGQFKVADAQRLSFGAEADHSSGNGSDANTDAVFALYEISPIKPLTLTGGLRYDHDDRYGSATTGKVAASWQASDDLRVRATWGQGFKAPTIFQSTFICDFCGLSAPNLNLKAETSNAWDAGLDWTLGRALLSLTAFDQRSRNLIDFSFTEGYANIDTAHQQGIEAAADVRIVKWFAIDAAYTYIDAHDGTGAELPRVPKNSGNVELVLKPLAGLTGSLAVRYNGEQDDGTGVFLKGWTRADLALTYEVLPGLEVYGRLENLFNIHYEQVAGYGAPGLSGIVGLRVKK